MKTIVVTAPGGPEVLQLAERPLPQPGHREVRVRVQVAGVNRADLLQRRGHYPAPPGAPSNIPGLEIMGTIDAVGPGVTRWQPGQRVFGLLAGGGYAEFAISREDNLAPVPDNLSDTEAGAVPEVFMTAHDALTQAGFRADDHVLIHAAGSGVATAAIQIVHALGGTTYGTARSPEKLERARGLGLDIVLPLPGFAAAAREATNGRGMDIVLDFIGAPYLQGNLEALAPLGRLIQIGTLAGNKAELDMGIVMAKRLRIFGTVLRGRSAEEKAAVTSHFMEELLPLLASGAICPVIDRVFPLHQASEAHAHLEANASFGKVLLQVTTA